MRYQWLTVSETVLIELEQSSDEGRDVRTFADDARIIIDMYNDGHLMEDAAKKLIDKIRSAPVKEDYPYYEPASLEDIKKVSPAYKNKFTLADVNKNILRDKIYGAWLGRCAGCLLGQPVEGWKRERIEGLLKDTNNYPLNFYISSAINDDIKKKYEMNDRRNWINNVSCMPEDDDTNYTILYLKTLEEYGLDFTSLNVAESWLGNVPVFHVCTAERTAYLNFVNLIPPPLSASHYNAYREWIGAQIRADFFGYAAAGNPEKAAEYAWRDARISHVKNGIYGEMFCAAMIAAAAVSCDMPEIIQCGLSFIPEKSRLAEGIKKVLSWYGSGINKLDAINNIHNIYDETNSHHWCHTISNAMICAAALLWGENDLEKTLGIAVGAGFDTDCNGATTGSIIGMINGADKLPEKWIKPLNNKVKSGISGFDISDISQLADRTLKLIK